ncbi:MAG TPA: hypothetical protein VH089_22780 [Streptosporangiaceae bacterium]|nr:hypothetical protein [Streptosporangiaceae bacterium]
MNPDVSVAPEIAQLMERPGPAVTSFARATIGDLARELKAITGTPDLWWSLVRFDAEHAVHMPIATVGAHQAWLSILPPAAIDHDDSDVVTVVAGELTERSTGTALKPLLPGQIRVHGAPGPRQAVNTSDGYTVSVHLRAQPGASRRASKVASTVRSIPESPRGPMPA